MKNNIYISAKDFLKTHKELILYIVFGVLTTVVNYISYVVFTRVFDVKIFSSNIIAWIVSVIFAYITNKLFVFESKSFKVDIILKEITKFILARVFSLFLDMLILYLLVNLANMSDLIVKIISNIIVIILNYVLSKFIIFKKDK
ncbi:MAG: GtrA family protein [Clostridia bacterium]